MNRLCVLVRKLYGHSFVRFAAVGGVATAVNYGTYVILIHNFDNLYPAIAYVLAFCVSISCNFVLSSYFTFGVKPTRARAVKFLTAHLINLFNELVLLEIWLWVGVPKPRCVSLWSLSLSITLWCDSPCAGSHTQLLKRKSRSQLRESVLGPYVLFIQCRRFTYRCRIWKRWNSVCPAT